MCTSVTVVQAIFNGQLAKVTSWKTSSLWCSNIRYWKRAVVLQAGGRREKQNQTKPGTIAADGTTCVHLNLAKAVCHLSGETWRIWLSLNQKGDSEWDFWLASQASYEKGFLCCNRENSVQFGSIILWHSWLPTTDYMPGVPMWKLTYKKSSYSLPVPCLWFQLFSQ